MINNFCGYCSIRQFSLIVILFIYMFLGGNDVSWFFGIQDTSTTPMQKPNTIVANAEDFLKREQAAIQVTVAWWSSFNSPFNGPVNFVSIQVTVAWWLGFQNLLPVQNFTSRSKAYATSWLLCFLSSQAFLVFFNASGDCYWLDAYDGWKLLTKILFSLTFVDLSYVELPYSASFF